VTWLTAGEALQVLGVRPQTLYANVSRKKIRAKPDPKDPRRSLYYEVDVRKLARQPGGRRKTTAVAAGAIEWGDPILPSAVSTVVEGRLYYRGQDAVVLSEGKTLEEVAKLLWGAEGIDFAVVRRTPAPPAPGLAAVLSTASPLQRAFLTLGRRAGTDLASYGRALPVLQAEAAGVLMTLTDAMLDSDGRRSATHERAAALWRSPGATDSIRRALVLLADHELNASTFAARVAVSTGAPLSAVVLSGLATLTGPLHGRASLGVLELISAVARTGADKTVRDWLSQGRHIAGFGHPLYPAGDPRAVALLDQFKLPREYAALRDVVEDVTGERPNVDFALAALTNVYKLPQDAPLILFALGRCAGWLAHALEQVTTGHPIRPRARYIGPRIS
jgi:citrate synthase